MTTTASPRSDGARRIFATLPDAGQLQVMLDEGEIRAAVAEWPEDAWRERA